MNHQISRLFAALLLGTCMATTYAADKKEASTPEAAVKKSDAGICHEKSSPSYGNTKKFTAFASMDECMKSGGKAPAGTPSTTPDPVKKSESGLCHDKSSPHYERTKKFTEFKTMDECMKSGGKLPK